MSAPNSRFGSYLENYNKENKFIISAVQRFTEQISTDLERMIAVNNELFKAKFTHLKRTLSDPEKSSYDKALFAGGLLIDLAPDIITCEDKTIKKSGVNIINSFLNLAKTTEDEQLLNYAMRIGERITV